MLDKVTLTKIAGEFLDTAPENYIEPAAALSPELAGLRIYDAPLLAFGDAADPLFERLKQPDGVGPQAMAPREWLPAARGVICLFAPYTQAIKKRNAADLSQPAAAWLHGRYEGQVCLDRLTGHLLEALRAAGYQAMAPSLDQRFQASKIRFTSNWSERHAGYICGLGTFGLSKGLITEKGVCGRLTSLITDACLAPEPRPYSGLYDYCVRCGACVRHCPAGAITMERGKEHPTCSEFLDKTLACFAPRYGCGKCQAGVPCESRNPSRRKSGGGN